MCPNYSGFHLNVMIDSQHACSSFITTAAVVSEGKQWRRIHMNSHLIVLNNQQVF